MALEMVLELVEMEQKDSCFLKNEHELNQKVICASSALIMVLTAFFSKNYRTATMKRVLVHDSRAERVVPN